MTTPAVVGIEEARAWVAEWMAAWNSHDLGRILSHYHDDVEYHSPFVAALGDPSGRLVGKEALGAYVAAALGRYPELHFDPPEQVAAGAGSVSFVYRSVDDLVALETLVFAPGTASVARAHCHYRPAAGSGPVEAVVPGEAGVPLEGGLDEVEFRGVLGHFATGVTVVTGLSAGRPVGLAANAFSSVSLDPPLVLVCIATTSRTWPLIRRSGVFAVNVLAEGQEEVCRRFGTPGRDRFDGTPWVRAPSGSPVLPEALAYVDCRIDAEHPAGDHVVVIGRVVGLGLLAGGRPLVFWRGGYGRLAE